MTDVVVHLVRLGLSEYEARAYIATVALGEGTVREISAQSGIPRSRAYDVMEHLAKRGFVQVGNSNPIRYQASEPLVASNHLMDEIKQANDEVVRELNEIGRRTEKAENPIWTLMGEWAIDHKITEIMGATRESMVFVCFDNRYLQRYIKLLSKLSHHISVTVAMTNQAERFVNVLENAKVMATRPFAHPGSELEEALNKRDFFTKGGRFSIEMILMTDDENALILTTEGKSQRAIIITGTILSLFITESVKAMINNAEEVSRKDRSLRANKVGKA